MAALKADMTMFKQSLDNLQAEIIRGRQRQWQQKKLANVPKCLPQIPAHGPSREDERRPTRIVPEVPLVASNNQPSNNPTKKRRLLLLPMTSRRSPRQPSHKDNARAAALSSKSRRSYSEVSSLVSGVSGSKLSSGKGSQKRRHRKVRELVLHCAQDGGRTETHPVFDELECGLFKEEDEQEFLCLRASNEKSGHMPNDDDQLTQQDSLEWAQQMIHKYLQQLPTLLREQVDEHDLIHGGAQANRTESVREMLVPLWLKERHSCTK
ncbi:unnamed protein product [Vitrella brassicaformis CCMP3155]|uniref:Uncharacterized protein n=1 Tax=Vitrella brassicaformis (strain CCMP3155) TaxID=1169540 RepID=A0A0G4FM37_VITBC|nr:unnamed protein product [Vitrella brassicaformis CCMP3155]|eukprot:CEM14883.1 unnamed protein product [Vitrella brassicaformis CCMP3155]